MAQKTVNDRLTRLEVQMEEIVVPTLKKVDTFIDENKSGIRTASILDNKIVTIVIGGIVVAGVYFLGKGGV